MAKAEILTMRRAYEALFFGAGEFRARLDALEAEFGADPHVARMIAFIRAGKRPLTMATKRGDGRRGRMSAPAELAPQGPLALICGGGSLPLAVADSVAAHGREVLLFPLRGAADPRDFAGRPHHWLHLGQFGKFARIARAAGCRDIVFIGSLVRPSLWQIRPDFQHCWSLPHYRAPFAAATITCCRASAKLIEQRGFRLCGAHEVAPEILAPAGALTRAQPSDARRAPISRSASIICAPPDPSTSGRRWWSRPARAGGGGGGRHRPDAGARGRIARATAACRRRRAAACW